MSLALEMSSRVVVDIITFAESPTGLGMRLFPVQRVILKAHYGLELDDNPYGVDLDAPIPVDHPHYGEITERGFYKHRVVITDWRGRNRRVMTEAGYLRYLHDDGRCNIREVTPGIELRELVLAIGRRSGKTTLAAVISAYETYRLLMKRNPQKYYGLPEANNIMITSVATDKDSADLLCAVVSGHYRTCAYFAPYTVNNTMSYTRFQTPADVEKFGRYADGPYMARASVKIDFRSYRAKRVKGAGNIVAVFDELAHFHGSREDVYAAVTPSVAAFTPKAVGDPTVVTGPCEGRIVSLSTPWYAEGFFYRLFQLGMAGAKDFLCIQAPTWEVNPTVPGTFLEKFRHKNPKTFDIEFGARFLPKESRDAQTAVAG